ncbi:hypothetical protein F2P81_019325 [Scophthalmus maximus]|uniref:Uncharacterized protein n=1 Tax=Scophthalmus maximus TaxID=52904 RepID=A0A6A4S7N7_SCOMX|nr:hypothetical protein F2P81_019325 [Scophthalmus maximus]
MNLQRSESKRFEAYDKSLWIQNKALSETLCLGQAACSLLRCAPHAAIQSSKSKTKPISILSHRSVLCPHKRLWTPCVLPPSEWLRQICLQG